MFWAFFIKIGILSLIFPFVFSILIAPAMGLYSLLLPLYYKLSSKLILKKEIKELDQIQNKKEIEGASTEELDKIQNEIDLKVGYLNNNEFLNRYDKKEASFFVKILTKLILIVVGGYTVYMIFLWASYIIIEAYSYSMDSDYRWIYLFIGYSMFWGPFKWMESKERLSSVTYSQEKGFLFYHLIGIIGYIFFAVFPAYISYPYGWFFDWWYK